jgi:hypothetical protein
MGSLAANNNHLNVNIKGTFVASAGQPLKSTSRREATLCMQLFLPGDEIKVVRTFFCVRFIT